LTANVYTDVAALDQHKELVKLPWWEDALPDAQKPVRPVVRRGYREVLSELIALAQKAVSEVEAGVSASLPLAARHGFEPCATDWQKIDDQLTAYLQREGYAQLDAHALAAQVAICALFRLYGEEPAPESGAKQGDESGDAPLKQAGAPHQQPSGGAA
jgi:hypothetical protein